MRILGFRPLLLGLAAVCGLAVHAAGGTTLSTPLVWKPTSSLTGIVNLTPYAGVKIAFLPLVDHRQDKGLLGENLEKTQPRYVRTSDPVEPFISAKLLQLMQETGLPMVGQPEGAAIQLSGELLRFGVTEKETYQGEFKARLEVRSAGQLLWQGMASGKATRFGRSYKLENYHEVLSDSLIEAMSRLLADKGFLDALAGKAPAAPAAH